MICRCEEVGMQLTLYGEPVTKKNHAQIVGPEGKKRLIQSKAYRDYEMACLWQITGRMRQKIAEPVTVQCVYYMPTRRRVDLINLLAATHDILVKGEVLADDNSLIICSVDGSRVAYDKESPRVEITISAFNP